MSRATNALSRAIYGTRWVLYPLNMALFGALLMYVVLFLRDDYELLRHGVTSLDSMMVALLAFVDAVMVANLIVMIIQGSHQIFIEKFELPEHRAQWLDHIDSGILKVKLALSISGITLIHILKDFVNLEQVDWLTVVHRLVIHLASLISALVMAVIWRVTHPERAHA